MKLILFVPVLALLLTAFGNNSGKILEKELVPEKNSVQPKKVEKSIENEAFVIELKNDGNYINNKLFSLDEIAKKAKTWQKTGHEDILLVPENQMSYDRVDEVRIALSNAKVYHLNQTTINSDEIIYPAGDVSSLATFTKGKWGDWLNDQLTNYLGAIPDDWEYTMMISFIIDENGKVREGHVERVVILRKLMMPTKKFLLKFLTGNRQ